MRQIPMRLLVLLFATLFCPTAANSELPPAREYLPFPDWKISVDDILVLRGRMRECMRWDGRVLEIHDLSKSTRVRMLGLREVDVEGMTVLEVHLRLAELLDETFYLEETPLVTVEARSRRGVSPLDLEKLVESPSGMKHKSCPADPPKAPAWWPRGSETRKEKLPEVLPPPIAPPPKDDPFYKSLAFRMPMAETPSAA